MDLFGTRIDLSFSNQALRDQIASAGFEVKKVKFDKKRDRFVAEAKDGRGQKLQAAGKTERLALSNLWLRITKRKASQVSKLASWATVFTDQLAEIAEAYSKAPVYEPKAATAFMELAKDCERRAKVLGEHLQIQVVNNPEPYPTAEKLSDDVQKRRKLVVSRAGVEHPLWSEPQVVAYRICHDVLGYVAADAGWDWHGENMAFAHHVALLSAEAQKALFAESIGQTAYATHYRAYGPQKVALFPQFMNRAQEQENPHKHFPGVHPDESHPPVVMPAIKSITSRWYWPVDTPHQKTATDSGMTDPNYGWQSGVDPMMTSNGLTLMQAYEDPLDWKQGEDNAAKLDTGWAQPKDPQVQQQWKQNGFDGQAWDYLRSQMPNDYIKMKQAIVNAFRVVMLSPKKILQGNAMHYQAVQHIPAGTKDPHVFQQALEHTRQEYNVARWERLHPGRGEEARYAHRQYQQFVKPFIQYVIQKKGLSYTEGKEFAERELEDMLKEAEDRIEQEDASKPEEKQRQTFQVEAAAGKDVAQQLKTLLAEHRTDMDQRAQQGTQQGFDLAAATVAPEPEQTEMLPQEPPLPGPTKYIAWMGSQVVGIARVEQHADDLLKAALEDVHNHDGAGHHFRAVALQLGVKGVGPKVCSFAWLLLQPMTSQLATIDTHMMNVMGATEESPKPRDYFGHERALAARRDALGYHHVPLGQFQWLMWDAERTGHGSHQDHSPLRPIKPQPWQDVDWEEPTKPDPNWADQTEWWKATQPIGDQAMDDYMQTLGPKVRGDQIPYQGLPQDYGLDVYTSRLAFGPMPFFNPFPTPWLMHPHTGEQMFGNPGETIMSYATRTLGLSPEEVWASLPDDRAGKLAS